MTDELKQFLMQQNILDLIDDGNYTEVYNLCGKYDRTHLTKFLLSCNIKPDDYMTEIPEYYLAESDMINSYCISPTINIIGDRAFSHCTGLKKISLPEGVTSIGFSAFYNCKSLNSIEIPRSVTSIRAEAFLDCARLYTISYKGTVEEWKHIDIAPGSFNNVLTSIVKCTDGVTRTL